MTAKMSNPRHLSILWCLLVLLSGGPLLAMETAAAANQPEGDQFIDTSLFVGQGLNLRQFTREAVIRATPAEVWAAWTTPAGIKQFLDTDARIELRIGGPYELLFATQDATGKRGSEGCQILSYIPGKMFSFSWNAPPLFPAERNLRTWVVVCFDELPSGSTRVELTHLGFGTGGRWDDVYEYFEHAWIKFMKLLAQSFSDENRSADEESP
jgi:uncharacterized protein YndB with AHSA1/START domain